ncbi:MAG TPA: hypothetical protein VID27_18155, partial [Blastocatellia bacterium]
ASFDISHLARAAGAIDRIRITNLINRESIIIEKGDGAFRLRPEQLSIGEETEFCIIEASVE